MTYSTLLRPSDIPGPCRPPRTIFLPSGSFPANAAGLACAAITHNLLRAAGFLASLAYAKATRRNRHHSRVKPGTTFTWRGTPITAMAPPAAAIPLKTATATHHHYDEGRV
jgi:hypothetical protein